jgi:mitochondrial Rho GTPase 1
VVLRPILPLVAEGLTQDQDGALKTAELDDVFSTSPGNPWATQKFPDTTLADDTGAVTLQGWLAQWRHVSHFTLFVDTSAN